MIDIRKDAAALLKDEFDIDPVVTGALFDKGIIREAEMKKVLLKDEYSKTVKRNGKQVLKHGLADKYCVSVHLVEKIVKNGI